MARAVESGGGEGGRDAAPVRIVLITAPDEETAVGLARGWVERGLVACANVVPSVRSVFRWNGVVEDARECLMIVKTTAEKALELERSLAREHPYENPECIVLAPEHVAPSYAAWVLECCGGEVPGDR